MKPIVFYLFVFLTCCGYCFTLELKLVVTPQDEAFKDICGLYQLSEADLAQELEHMRLWCIYDTPQEAVGAIDVQHYHSLSELTVQVTDPLFAEELWEKGALFELSYALKEGCRGQGLGSNAVELWMREERAQSGGSPLFAVVEEDNQASIRILEKNDFFHIGNYVHSALNKTFCLYCEVE